MAFDAEHAELPPARTNALEKRNQASNSGTIDQPQLRQIHDHLFGLGVRRLFEHLASQMDGLRIQLTFDDEGEGSALLGRRELHGCPTLARASWPGRQDPPQNLIEV